MKKRLIINDIQNNKLLSVSAAIFMAVSSMLSALTCFLLMGLLGSIDVLMEDAKTPDFLQMHSGEMEEQAIADFAAANEDVADYQVMDFLNLDNSAIYLGDHCLSDSTQDNGVIVQSEKFDFLVDTDNQIIQANQGEIYVPICYKQQYAGIACGDVVRIGDKSFRLAGFLRDSQMNSMMSSSKRFLVCEDDFNELFPQGSNEYLIEFLLKDGADTGKFQAAYTGAFLPANGPAITRPLIKVMNALSDGMVFMVIFLVSIVMLLISILCIRFTLLAKLTADRREIGMLKAVGISRKDIRSIYFLKFLALSLAGAVLGIVLAGPAKTLLQGKLQEMYGLADNAGMAFVVAVIGVAAALSILLCSIWRTLKKTERMSCIEALVGDDTGDNKRKSLFLVVFVVAAGVFLMCVPQNLYSTISSEKFVTYMGIGSGEVRIDLRLTEDMLSQAEIISGILEDKPQIDQYVSYVTKNYTVKSSEGSYINLNVEQGDHAMFPVSYNEGNRPAADDEIALSYLSAEELQASVGDEIEIIRNGVPYQYRVCGIYSDLTNGGKTAKALYTEDDARVMWITFYASPCGNADMQDLLFELENDFAGQGINAKIYDIREFVLATYGQTMDKIKLASAAVFAASLVIIFVVVFLFLRLMLARDRYDLSLKKAIGFTRKMISASYEKSFLLAAAIGIAAGVFAGKFLGEMMVGVILGSLGAPGFAFIVSMPAVLGLIPLCTMVIVAVSVKMGLKEVADIKGYECCLGRE